MKSAEERFWDKVNFDGPLIKNMDTLCWEWLGAKISGGYGQLRFGDGNVLAHRFSKALVEGAVPKHLLVCHHCDNPSCVNPQHLFIGTHQDNATDRINKGRGRSGGKGPPSKLTQLQILEIFNDKRIYKDIASDYSITPSTVCLIKSGVLHSNITGRCYAERLGPRRLTDEEVLTIFNDSRSVKDIAKDFGICKGEVHLIKNGRLHGSLTHAVPQPTKTRLSSQEVLSIVTDLRSDKVLGLIYGVNAKTIYRIKHGQSRSKVTGINI